ncbi:hypothetical protein KIF59_07565 [Enterobacter cloacae subsp. cloacae]|nr:hypothetical protein [Enterobacter cloacae subsp. cloacae]
MTYAPDGRCFVWHACWRICRPLRQLIEYEISPEPRSGMMNLTFAEALAQGLAPSSTLLHRTDGAPDDPLCRGG